jgi:hypothetical protein
MVTIVAGLAFCSIIGAALQTSCCNAAGACAGIGHAIISLQMEATIARAADISTVRGTRRTSHFNTVGTVAYVWLAR